MANYTDSVGGGGVDANETRELKRISRGLTVVEHVIIVHKNYLMFRKSYKNTLTMQKKKTLIMSFRTPFHCFYLYICIAIHFRITFY